MVELIVAGVAFALVLVTTTLGERRTCRPAPCCEHCPRAAGEDCGC